MYLKLKFIRTRSVVAQLLAVLLSFKLFYFRFCCILRDVSICIGTVSPLVSLEGTLCQIPFSTSGSLQRMLLFKYPSKTLYRNRFCFLDESNEGWAAK